MNQLRKDWRLFAGVLGLLLIFGIVGEMEANDLERLTTTSEGE